MQHRSSIFSTSFNALLLLLISLFFPFPAQAGTSPEFHQLLGEVNAQLKTFTPTRGPHCTPDLIDKVQNALQGEIFTGALNAVVVKPLETGAKAGLSMLGIPAVAITTYSLMRCAMDESDATGFGKCALGEAIGYGAGAGIDKAGADAISGALAGVAIDDAYGRVRDAYDSYQSTSEIVEGESEGDCKIKYTVRWLKRKAPGARGGKIHFQAWVSDCNCDTPNEAKSGYVSTWFKVNYARAGNSQPGWKLNTFEKLHVEVQCCGQSAAAKDYVHLFNPQGLLVRDTPPVTQGPTTGTQPEETETDDEGGDDTSTTPTPPKPPPQVILPAPERQEYTRANPCPPCKPIQDKITEVAAELGDLLRQRSGKLGDKNQKESDKGKVERQIERLESRLRGESGVGGESTDREGNTTSSYDTGDGRVRIRVTDAQGNVLSERFRQRESTADIQARLAEKKAELGQNEKDIEQLQKEIEEIDTKRDDLKKKYDNLQNALTDCVKRLCNKYATCEQLLKHIESYESAGLQVRSRGIINNLKRRAREMGCYGIDEEMSQLVSDNYDMTGAHVYKPSVMLPALTTGGGGAPAKPGGTAGSGSTSTDPLHEWTFDPFNDDEYDEYNYDRDRIKKEGGANFLVPRDAACPECAGEAEKRNGLISEYKALEERANRVTEWLDEASEAYESAKNTQVIKDIRQLEGDMYAWEREIKEAEASESGKSGRGYTAAQLSGARDKTTAKLDQLKKQNKKELENLEDASNRLRRLRQRSFDLWAEMRGIGKDIIRATRALESCEKEKCTTVKILNVISLGGNNPYDRQDPLSGNSNSAGTIGAIGTPGATVKVINNIPISRLSLAGPDACSYNHYHGGANNCNGVFTPDPAPGVCGQGIVMNVKTIPVTSCPDL